MNRSTYITEMNGQARYSNPGYSTGQGTNGRFSINNHYQGLEHQIASNQWFAASVNDGYSPFQWDELAWQEAIGVAELDEDGKQAFIAAHPGINQHPWPIEAEHNPWATAPTELGSTWANPATGSGAYSSVYTEPSTPGPVLQISPVQQLQTFTPTTATPQQTQTVPTVLSGLPVRSADLPAALQPLDNTLAAAVGGDGTIFGMSPLLVIGAAIGGFFLLSSMNGGKKNV